VQASQVVIVHLVAILMVTAVVMVWASRVVGSQATGQEPDLTGKSELPFPSSSCSISSSLLHHLMEVYRMIFIF